MNFIINYLTEIGIAISFFSLIISVFAFTLVYLNRNDKFRPHLFAYYDSSLVEPSQAGVIFVKNFGSVPGFISSVKLNSVYDIYTRTEQYAFLQINEVPSDAKLRQEYINTEDSLKRSCENRTFLPDEKIGVQIIDPIFTESRDIFDNTDIYKLKEQQKEKDYESSLTKISLVVEYKKSKFFLPFPVTGIDRFKEEFILFESNENHEETTQ
ncbi:hypothetical protein SAMN05421781_0018 [Marinococcus luteus]|uniref:Uncharacterized protein n=1 Tax=Marinococcus luteus TaxID=1122204 RepID=A0A1H2Y9V2_9BACI|nr:hypothetical protein [Marinococcus luteus]SDX01926.1 hypothetical protein SAMN05421781_0018 [Marinococcus luteus]